MQFKNNIRFGILISSALCLFSLCACTKRPANTAKPHAPSKIELLESAVAGAPTFENLIELGYQYGLVGRGDEAMAMYNRAIEVNPKSAIGWNNLCAQFNAKNMFAEAVEACEKAAGIDPKYELAQNNLNLARIKLAEQKKQVLEKNANWASRNNLSGEDLINIGMDYYTIRDLTTANKVWSRVKKGDPLYAMAKSNLASLYIRQGRFADAETSISVALKLEPNNQIFLNNKSWLEKEKSVKK